MKTRVATFFVSLLVGFPAAILLAWPTALIFNSGGKIDLPQQQSGAPQAAPEGDACEDSWSLVASLNWGANADWDLHLQTPNAHVFYGNRNADGFSLDRDAYPQCTPTPLPPEGITGRGKCGTYRVYSNLFSTCGGMPQTAFTATLTPLQPIRINGTLYTPGETFNPEDNVAFVVERECITSLDVGYLSQANPLWGPHPYDHIAPKTISDKGCALTSLLMAMNYGGLSGVTPGTLNASATALRDGYIGRGSVNWGKIAKLGNFRFEHNWINSVESLQAAKDYLDHVLCELERPVVVAVFNTARGAACRDEAGADVVCHFVLVTGKQNDGRYRIADPGSQNNTTLDAYGNRFETRGYVVPAGSQSLRQSPAIFGGTVEQLIVTTGGRVSLLMFDPAGNRTGTDPVSGRMEAIPNSTYFIDSLGDDVIDEEHNEVTHSIYVEQPSVGRYEIRVTPSQDGPFRLSATTLSADGSEAYPLSIDGVGVSGQTQVFYFSLGNLASLANISTRLRVETGDNALIGGFIVTGTQPKRIIVRAIGPSLPLAGALPDPVLELRNSSGGLIASNDDWRTDQQAEIIATGIPPTNILESAIVATLPANNSAYTAIVRGYNNATGIGVVEAYDLDQTVNSKLANISTRGFVNTGDNVMIGGTIILGSAPANILFRAIGPSLTNAGIPNALPDPTLELRDSNGALIAFNDDWRTDQQAEIIATGIPPTNILESAILRSLPPGAYTAIVRGYLNGTGVGLVEAYQLQ